MARVDYLHQHAKIAAGLNHLLSEDDVFSRLGLKANSFLWRKRTAGFPSFVSTIVGQQISVKAAASIYQKLHDRLDGRMTPDHLLSLSTDDLRACGLSFGKIKYAQGVAEKILDGSFSPAKLRYMSDADIVVEITRLNGFGVWSAQMFMIFALCRPDIWPIGDLGIQIGAQYYLGVPEKPKLKSLEELGEKWSGHRTAASLILWHMSNNKIRP